MNIMDMTLRQILHNINLPDILITLSVIMNFEAIVRQVAVNKGYKNIVSWCDRAAAMITFILDVCSSVKNKQLSNINKTAPVILLCVGLTFLIGCAPFHHSSDYTLTGTNIKTVYGTGDVNLHIVGETSWGKCNAINK